MLNRQALLDNYGLQPIAASLFSNDSYYLYMILQIGDQGQLIFLNGTPAEAEIRGAIEGGLKRAAPGFLKTVGLWTPPATPTQNPFGQQQPPFSSWQQVSQQLSQDYELRNLDLMNGQVPTDVDVLLLVAPQMMTDTQRYAIDQFLMRGGSVIVAGGSHQVDVDPFTGQFTLRPVDDGLAEMLDSYGLQVENGQVMDPQNEPFPVPVTRDAGGFQIQEYQELNYPYFVDVRSDGMDAQNPIVNGLTAVTLNWVSPVAVDETANADRNVTVLLKSTDQAWLRTDPNLQPDLENYPDLGFPPEGEPQSYPLAVAVQGTFESFFKDKPIPEAAPTTAADGTVQPVEPNAVGTITASPGTARLVVIGSADFLNDAILNISLGGNYESQLNRLQLVQNSVDWSVEDLDLLSIRSRGARVRLLDPLTDSEQTFWEGLNYAVALLALVAIGVVWNIQRKNEKPMELTPSITNRDQEVPLEQL
jgi:ABC-2 type transport system permease protein